MSSLASGYKPLQAASSLLMFRSPMAHPVAMAWQDCLRSLMTDAVDELPVRLAYGRWFEARANVCGGKDWLIESILIADNAFSRAAAAQEWEDIPPVLIEAAAHDLQCLQTIWNSQQALPEHVRDILGTEVIGWPLGSPRGGIEQTLATTTDWGSLTQDLASHYRHQGVGLFGQFHAARWYQGELVGVETPDAMPLAILHGCDRQKQLLCENTEALLAGLPALNILLYGARGTGKSSLVKGLLHKYGDRGLRIVEVARTQLHDLLQVVDALSHWPQSFIVFVDDLSFAAEETEYKQLKVMLEGDIAARPKNVCLYATSNRRHLIREYFADRPSPADDEVHAWDTVQEKLSLSDRFGLSLTFPPFTQRDYFNTVYHLAECHGLTTSKEELRRGALVWAQQQNGFSGRTAKQFINHQQGVIALTAS